MLHATSLQSGFYYGYVTRHNTYVEMRLIASVQHVDFTNDVRTATYIASSNFL